MRRIFALFVGVVCTVRLLGAGAFTGEAAVIASIRAASNAAIAAHDSERVVAFMEDDVRITAGGGAALDGKEAVRKKFQEHFAQQADLVYTRSPGFIEPSTAGPVAAEHGTWVGQWKEPGKGVIVRGYYMAMWRKTKGVWLIRSELFVTLERSENGVTVLQP